MARRIESHFIAGPAGRLEALLEEPEEGEPQEAALVCHPHPAHGGTMHNKVVYRMARGLRRAGAVVLRFNYRGVNLSEGQYDKGEGEVEDARVALAWLRERYPALPYTLAGFSFGSRIVLKLGCEQAGAERVIAVGFPAKYADAEFLPACAVAKQFVHSSRDQFGSVQELQTIVESLREPRQIQFIDAQDHFFAGALEQLEEVIKLLPRGR